MNGMPSIYGEYGGMCALAFIFFLVMGIIACFAVIGIKPLLREIRDLLKFKKPE